jgi:hypothetical protein
MKIMKPDNLGLLFKSFTADGQIRLSLSACACFTLNTETPNRLFEEPDMWPVIEASPDKDEIFDAGLPKIRGEWLVYGSAFAQRPVQALEVSVSVGFRKKLLHVFGNRYRYPIGSTEPEAFKQIPVSWTNAFGGPDFPANPIGKGAESDEPGRQSLPNVQVPGDQASSAQERSRPAGFTAYPMMWPQRMAHMGNYGKDWLFEDWPHLPRDTNWEYFNVAPEDQRLPEFFTGEEKIEIRNMHPLKPLIRSALPALGPASSSTFKRVGGRSSVRSPAGPRRSGFFPTGRRAFSFSGELPP